MYFVLGHLVLNLALDGITGFEFLQVFCGVVVQGDADGEALLDFDEVAGGIVNWDERERAAGGIGETEDTAFVLDVGNGVHMDRDLRAFVDMRQLRLAVVGFHPFLVLIHNADERLTGVDEFADIDVTRPHKTRVRGDDVTLGEIDFG